MKVRVEDRRSIKSITFKNPELMNSNAEDSIREHYNKLIKKQDELYEYRAKVMQAEEDLQVLKEVWQNMLYIMDVEYGLKEIEYQTKKANFSVFGCGNDSYGNVSYNK